MVEPGKACLTLHQPWASLLVYGIKRIEGRSWPSPIRGKLWIHAASKVPEPETIKAMESFYREIYAVDGVTEIEFPKYYPTSVLLGCVEVVGCLKLDELICWEDLSNGVRLEGQTEFCWLCESPQKLVMPLQMRGRQGIYNIQKSILDGASRAVKPICGPAPITFPPLPSQPSSSNVVDLQKGPNGKLKAPPKSAALEASIAGARQAASQFRRQEIQMQKQQQALEEQQRVKRNKSPGQSTDSSSSSSLGDSAEARWAPSESTRIARAMHMESVRPTSRILAQALRSSHQT
ncbi:activating signal cointegrator 1 [Marchantia polymorpha subsp. ruderalis]|uniref:ASCH domain-containing protein n=1 Tax=Marchantia polymorpha TaxID=3197 RepID=A0A2R6XBH0_MARPO|nr:hypothetical protein MARPO_0025s0138 [Marchantia polymorpha]BBN03674.1 hypothetical protein Mp_2g25400 [Marchantia polymorpha subsp. ruderalis]|eukprot:PTQ43458.1 hypothetical protein MARPO_0025s0138 [Marchantia polymorpha]